MLLNILAIPFMQASIDKSSGFHSQLQSWNPLQATTSLLTKLQIEMNLIPDKNRGPANKTASLTQTKHFKTQNIFFFVVLIFY